MNTFSALTDELFEAIDEGVGDLIKYQMSGASRASDIMCWVDHSDKTESYAGGAVVAQDIMLEVRKELVPSVSTADRIFLPELKRWFNPKEWKNGPAGKTWIIYVKVER